MKIKHLAALLTLCACAATAQAQSAGSFILSTGWEYFMPRSQHTFGGYIVNDNPQPSEGMNLGVRSNKQSTLGLTGTYFITDNVAGEFMLNTPANLSLTGTGDWDSVGKFASAKQWSPALLLKYYFGSAQAKFRPFLGAGVSHTWFANVHPSPIVSTVFETPSFSINNQWGGILNGGFSYQFNEHWFTGLSVSYMTLRPNATFKAIAPGNTEKTRVTSTAKLKLNPVITFVNVGYRF